MMFATGTLEDSYFYWSMIRAGGLSLRWFRDRVAGRAGDPLFYAEMDELASNVPAGANGLLFYPYLQGAGPDTPGACGVFAGALRLGGPRFDVARDTRGDSSSNTRR